MFPGGDEGRADDVRHNQVPAAQRHVRRQRAGRPIGIPAHVAQHAGPQRLHDRRRVQPARVRRVRRARRLHRHRCHRVLRGGRMGILRIVLFCLHIHVDHRIRRFCAEGERHKFKPPSPPPPRCSSVIDIDKNKQFPFENQQYFFFFYYFSCCKTNISRCNIYKTRQQHIFLQIKQDD